MSVSLQRKGDRLDKHQEVPAILRGGWELDASGEGRGNPLFVKALQLLIVQRPFKPHGEIYPSPLSTREVVKEKMIQGCVVLIPLHAGTQAFRHSQSRRSILKPGD
ncbi:hypothetical protein KUCAC02_001705, partial [Chaenocephalus aceratus]